MTKTWVSENAPWPIPDTWIWCYIGDVCDVVGGGTPSTSQQDNFSEGNVPWITPADLSTHKQKYIERGERNISSKGFTQSAAKMLPSGSVLFSSRAPIGYVVIAKNELCTNQGFKSFIVPPELNPEYLYYYLIHAKPLAISLASGTTFLEVSGKKIATLPFCIPPRSQQERIVTKIEELFSELDAGVAALERVRAGLKWYRAAVLKAAVEGKLTEDWRAQHPDTEPASALLDRILAERRRKWEEAQLAKFAEAAKQPSKGWQDKYIEPESQANNLPKLQATWSWATSEQLCEHITKGTTPAAEDLFTGSGDIPFIKIYNLTKSGQLDFGVNPTFIQMATHKSNVMERSKVYPSDVLMSIVGPPLGKVSIVPDVFPEWNVNQAIAIFRPISGLSSNYLTYCLLTSHILNWAISRSKATAGQHNLTLETVRGLPIPLPPNIEQEKIVLELDRRLSVVHKVETQIEAELKRAVRLRQGILKRAFEGRLVPQDPTDEPAEQLLARIRQQRAADASAKGGRTTGRPRKSSKRDGKVAPLFPEDGDGQGGRA